VKLNNEQSGVVGALLKQGGARHPWTDGIGTHWGKDSKTPILKVRPDVVVDVAAERHCRPATTGMLCA
jgi:hypothetical protein